MKTPKTKIVDYSNVFYFSTQEKIKTALALINSSRAILKDGKNEYIYKAISATKTGLVTFEKVIIDVDEFGIVTERN